MTEPTHSNDNTVKIDNTDKPAASPEATSSPETKALTRVLELNTQAMQDSKKATYFKYGVILTGILAYVGATLAFHSSMSGNSVDSGEPHASLVTLSGTIQAGGDINTHKVNPLLKEAFADKAAKAVVLNINSPGGSPVQSSQIHDQILRLKAEYKKPVIVVVDDYAASGGYFIASAADKIVVNKSSIVGSIGVISSSFGFTGLMDKLGVERRVMTAGESKNLGDPFMPETERGLAVRRGLITEIHQHFKEAVIAGRPKIDKTNPDMFSGMVWTGATAIKNGVADELGDLETVRKQLGIKSYIEYAEDESPFKNLVSKFGMSIGSGVSQSVKSELTQSTLE